MTSTPIPVAQYLRMSTEHQKYSLENQESAIGKYAREQGFSVVQTYCDSARSGLALQNRAGLRGLLHDVTSGAIAFKAILVYDVSRWGRFQDADESAHYEFLCKQAGIPVHYCAELFANDGTLANALLKTIKRSMAAEYSRELGVKCLAGQRNVYQRGFKGGGGRPGYGLRRMLISEDGVTQRSLGPGDRKALATDRVILVPGPHAEVACIYQIYRLFLEEKYSFSRIARLLNSEGVPYQNGALWNPWSVRKILTSSKYNGCLIYGRTSRRLHTKETKTPESEWLRVQHPTAKIVEDTTFAAVQQRIATFTLHKSNNQLLDELRSILAANGRLTSTIIRKTLGATPPASLRGRFGSLIHAYDLIGYNVPVAQLVATRKEIQNMREQFMQQIQKTNPAKIIIRGKGRRTRNWLQLPHGMKVSVRFCAHVAGTNRRAWYMREAKGESHWTTLVALLSRDNAQIEQRFVFPRVPASLRYVSSNSNWLENGVALDDIHKFYDVVKEVYSEHRLRKI